LSGPSNVSYRLADSDPNMTNMLITRDWRVWLIDFTRAFRQARTLNKPDALRQIDRTLLTNLRTLTAQEVQQALGRWLMQPELQALLARRDRIVQLFDEQLASRGEAAVLYDLDRTSEPCGHGLSPSDWSRRAP
jgi:hypothetical protein